MGSGHAAWGQGALRLAVLALALLGAAEVRAQRLALVVGNGGYIHVAPAPTAVADAEAVANALAGAGFEVTRIIDAGSGQMQAALDGMSGRAAVAEAVVLFYAGQSVQLGGENRLVPVEARLDDPARLVAETVPLSEVIARLTPAAGPLIVLLEAATASPVAPQARRLGLGGGGLAPMDAPRGGAVVMSAAPGALAYQRPGAAMGAFATALTAHLGRPGLTLSEVMLRVASDVEVATVGRQVPWMQSGLRAPFLFVPEAVPPPAPVPGAVSGAVSGAVPDVTVAEPASPAPAREPPPVAPRLTEADINRLVAMPPDQRAAFLDLLEASRYPAEDLARARAAIGVNAVASAGEEPTAPDDLPRAVQAELARLGCYRQMVDGDWGPGSRRALLRYFEVKGTQPPDPPDPTEAVWRVLLDEAPGLCPAPVPARAPVAPRKTAPATGQTQPSGSAPARREPTCQFVGAAIVCR